MVACTGEGNEKLTEAALREILRRVTPGAEPDRKSRRTYDCLPRSAANQRMNLTAITDPEEMAVKHIPDSVSRALAVELAEG